MCDYVFCSNISILQNLYSFDASNHIDSIIRFLFFLGWFGLRKDFCQFLLGICPFLQEYANIAYNSQINLGDSRTSSAQQQSETEDPVITNLSHKTKCKSGKNVQIIEPALKPVAQIISIDMPD